MKAQDKVKLIAVLTCFNRKSMTLACLKAVEHAAAHAGVDLRAVVVDDASTDGTAIAVQQAFPWADVVSGSGALYWNRGMHEGFGRALQQAADYYLWINDDTLLLPDALQRLLQQSDSLRHAEGKPAIIVGATADEGGRISYGGSVAQSRLKRLSYRSVWSDDVPVLCEAMNGNCVLIPREVALRVGNLDPAFEHAMGDTDYALRARQAGYSVYVCAGIAGRCSNNPTKGTFNDRSLPLRTRWRLMMDKKGLPIRSWLRFTRKHGGFIWPLYFAWPYAKLILTGFQGALVRRACLETIGNQGAMSRTVVFAQRHLPHFRVPFYEKLRSALAADDVRVRVLVGDPTPQEVEKSDAGKLSWSEHRRTRYALGGLLCWMPLNADLGEADLLVFAQENRLVLNLWELLRRRKHRVAFWGHGRNLQSSAPDGLRERFKFWTTRRADWYFAYTDLSYQILRNIGYPADRITVVNNAIDTQQMISDRESISAAETQTLRDEMGLAGKPVGMFLGSLYAMKGLDFALEAALAIRRRLPDFNWLVMGDGPDRSKVQAMVNEHPWVRWVGARLGREKVLYAGLCDVLMEPSALGLVVLDSFALGKPIITVRDHKHSPEVEYLQDGADCLMTERGVDQYANAVAELLIDRQRLSEMQKRCLLKASTYSIEAMVENMRLGVLAAMRA